jgi:DNA-directed RNA polymerase subunit omega
LTNSSSLPTFLLPVPSAFCRVQVSLTMSSQLLEEASKIIPNTALLVNLVSKRVRQLTMGHRPLVEVGPRMSNADVALKEIIDGKLTFEFQPEPAAKV